MIRTEKKRGGSTTCWSRRLGQNPLGQAHGSSRRRGALAARALELGIHRCAQNGTPIGREPHYEKGFRDILELNGNLSRVG
jgi:hypothetical protein